MRNREVLRLVALSRALMSPLVRARNRGLVLLRVPALSRALMSPLVRARNRGLVLLQVPALSRALMLLLVPARKCALMSPLVPARNRGLRLLRVPALGRALKLPLVRVWSRALMSPLVRARNRGLVLLRVPALSRALLLLLMPALIASAQSPIGHPRVGCFRDGGGSLRPVWGVAGNFILGDAEQSGVLAAACRGKLTAVKTETALELRDRDSGRVMTWPAPAGPALFAFPADGSAPLAFFPTTFEWLRLAEGASVRALPPMEGEPLAISSADGARAAFLVRREGGLFLVKVSLAWGYVLEETELAALHAPALVQPDGVVLAADGTDVVVRTPLQDERRIALPAPAAAMEHLGEGWVRVALEGGGHMALRLLPGGEELFRLPEVAQ